MAVVSAPPRPTRADVALMLLLLVPSVAQVLLVPIGPRPLAVLFAVASVGPLAWRRAAPLAAAAVGTAAWWIPLAGFDGFLVLGFVVAVLLFFSVGAYVESLRATLVVLVWALVTGTATTLLGPEDPIAVLGVWLVCVAPVVAGRVYAAQREQATRLRRLASLLERERDLERRTAVAEERARIARELHDVVGHEMTMIAIQAEAAALALETAPDRARDPVEAIRSTAHRAGSEMRALLGVLRGDEDGAEPAPDTEQLVSRARAGGLDVRLRQEGEPWPDEPNAVLAVHRIVQECLTNAHRHAPGQPVDLALRWTHDQVTLRATNPCPAPAGPPGLGLLGMGERARLLNGDLVAGQVGGEFRVEATVRASRGGGQS